MEHSIKLTKSSNDYTDKYNLANPDSEMRNIKLRKYFTAKHC